MPTYACECKWECACVCECVCAVSCSMNCCENGSSQTRKLQQPWSSWLCLPWECSDVFLRATIFQTIITICMANASICVRPTVSLSLCVCGLWLYGPAEWLFNWCSSQRLTTNFFRLPQFSYYFQFWPLTRIECGSILVKILLFDSLSVVRNRIEWHTLVIEVGIP